MLINVKKEVPTLTAQEIRAYAQTHHLEFEFADSYSPQMLFNHLAFKLGGMNETEIYNAIVDLSGEMGIN